MSKFQYNPILEEHKNPVGAVPVYKDITLNLKVCKTIEIKKIELVIKDDNNNIYTKLNLECLDNDDNFLYYHILFNIGHVGLYWYYFDVNNGEYYLGSREDFETLRVDHHPKYWPILIHYAFNSDLGWFKGKIMYQIFVDRFFKGGNNPPKKDIILHKSWHEKLCYKPVNGLILNNDFYGGDLEGIIKKLPYLKELNVGIIYLNPIFEASSNHKYDTGDYLKIDQMFGTEEGFKKLIEEANKYNIKIILDGVFNHTGDNSLYFNKYNSYPSLGAYQSKSSPYYNWYRFTHFPDKYDSWWGFHTLPSVNQNDPWFLDFMTGSNGVINKWLQFGSKGFRIDVIDELNNNFIYLINQAIKKVSNDNIIIGEVWEEAVTKVSYGIRRSYFNGHQIDSVMNYPLKDAILEFLKYNNINRLKIQIRELINNYPKHALDCLMNHLGTHDTLRLLNNFADSFGDDLTRDQQAHYIMRDEELARAIENLKLATVLQFTLPGVPCIYYGDEIGMQGFRDPFCRGPFEWDNINYDILNWYKKLADIRINNGCFVDGVYKEEYIHDNIFAYSRIKDHNKILIIVNNNEYPVNYKISKGIDLLCNFNLEDNIIISRKTAKIIKINRG